MSKIGKYLTELSPSQEDKLLEGKMVPFSPVGEVAYSATCPRYAGYSREGYGVIEYSHTYKENSGCLIGLTDHFLFDVTGDSAVARFNHGMVRWGSNFAQMIRNRILNNRTKRVLKEVQPSEPLVVSTTS